MKNLLLLTTLLVLLGGCAAKEVPVDFDPAYPVQRLESFTLEAEVGGPPDPLNDQRLREAVEEVLLAKGYKAYSEGGDFIVRYGMELRRKVPGPVTIGLGFGGIFGNVGGSLSTAMTPRHDEALFTLRMIDPATKRVFWSASVRKAWKESRAAWRRQVIDEAVREMLATFPARGEPFREETE
ncbi:DUF4136 domain-containing protein [Hydrogenimonas sp.]